MAWTKKTTSSTWNKSSDSSNDWTSKTNKLGTWLVHRVSIRNQTLLNHRLCFGTIILGSFVYNGIKDNWIRGIPNSKDWSETTGTGDTWDKKSQASETWMEKTPITDGWNKSSDKVSSWTKK